MTNEEQYAKLMEQADAVVATASSTGLLKTGRVPGLSRLRLIVAPPTAAKISAGATADRRAGSPAFWLLVAVPVVTALVAVLVSDTTVRDVFAIVAAVTFVLLAAVLALIVMRERRLAVRDLVSLIEALSGLAKNLHRTQQADAASENEVPDPVPTGDNT
jgi:hypothetical protein